MFILAVHPHVCGEHLWQRPVIPACIGSSPRVWGTCIVDHSLILNVRFIPTCVGNICHCHRLRDFGSVHPHVCGEHAISDLPGGIITVHPHVCGEHLADLHLISTSVGSSPRVWGTYTQVEKASQLPRFIPTCVGNIFHFD